MSTIHTRIDVNDIVGKQFGGFVVVEYSHKEVYKRKDKMGSRHWYVIECLLCGKRKLEYRGKIRTKQSVCFECRKKNMKEYNKLNAENRLYKIKPNKNNANKIKHLHNGKEGRKEVAVMVDRKRYKLYDGYDESKALVIANELNDILQTGGKKAFLQWFEENYK